MESIFSFSGMDCDHYSATLAGFYSNNPEVTDVNFGAQDVSYGTEAIAYRDLLINEQGWTISGDIMSDNNCDLLLSSEFPSSSGENRIKIYPNPSSDQIYIAGNPDEIKHVHIFNSIGEDVSSDIPLSRISNDEIKADVSALANGVYHVRTAAQFTRFVKF
jgi:hypothetical protein